MARFSKKTRSRKKASLQESLFISWEKDFPEILQSYKGVIVAASGGLDSTVLFHLIHHFAKEKINFSLALCHINFNLRSNESFADENFIQKLASDYNVPLLLHQAPKAPTRNIQEWARNYRQAIFKDYITKGWLIALGHHKDDIAESTLMRLARGKSLAHMGGMSFLHQGFFRPFLKTTKKTLEDHAYQHQIHWRQDSSNNKSIYKRNMIRNNILPALKEIYPAVSEHLARASFEAKELSLYVQEMLRPAMERYGNKLPSSFLLSLPQTVAMTVLASFIGPQKHKRKELNNRFLIAVLTALKSHSPSTWSIQVPASKLLLRLKDDHLSLEGQPEIAAKSRQHEISLKQRNLAAILQDKDYFQTYRLPGLQALFDVDFTNRASGKVILSSPERHKTYSFGNKRLKSKELYELYQIPAAKRAELLLVSACGLKNMQQELLVGVVLGKDTFDPVGL